MELIFSYKYIKNTPANGRVLIEHLLNMCRRPLISKKARKSLGQAKEKRRGVGEESGWDMCPWEGAVKGKFFCMKGSPFTGRQIHRDRGSFGASEESIVTGSLRPNQRDLHSQHCPALPSLRYSSLR